MRKIMIIVCLLSLVVAGVVFAANARVLNCTSYTPTGCASVAGWDWLRTANASVTYTFNTAALSGCTLTKVHLNFAGLCTNGASGGSGYGATLTWKVEAGDATGSYSMTASNHFRPQDPNNSGGVGYAAAGSTAALSSALVTKAIDTGSMKVTLAWQGGVSSGRHVACKRDALSLGYIK